MIADAYVISIRVFDSTYRVNAIKSTRTYNPRSVYLKGREGARLVLEVMRDSDEQLKILPKNARSTHKTLKPALADSLPLFYKLQARGLVIEVSRDAAVAVKVIHYAYDWDYSRNVNYAH